MDKPGPAPKKQALQGAANKSVSRPSQIAPKKLSAVTSQGGPRKSLGGGASSGARKKSIQRREAPKKSTVIAESTFAAKKSIAARESLSDQSRKSSARGSTPLRKSAASSRSRSSAESKKSIVGGPFYGLKRVKHIWVDAGPEVDAHIWAFAIAQSLDYVHVDPSALLKRSKKYRTAQGGGVITDARMMSDENCENMITEEMMKNKQANGFVFNGFPYRKYIAKNFVKKCGLPAVYILLVMPHIKMEDAAFESRLRGTKNSGCADLKKILKAFDKDILTMEYTYQFVLVKIDADRRPDEIVVDVEEALRNVGLNVKLDYGKAKEALGTRKWQAAVGESGPREDTVGEKSADEDVVEEKSPGNP